MENALNDISVIIHIPHFKTKTGKKFKFEEANEALAYSSTGGKAILLHSPGSSELLLQPYNAAASKHQPFLPGLRNSTGQKR